MADIEADIATEATAADEIRAETKIGLERDDEAKDEAESNARGTIDIGVDRVSKPKIPADSLVPASDEGSREDFKIGLDVVIQDLYDHMEENPAWRIADIKEEQRAQDIQALADERERERDDSTMTITRSGMTPEAIEEMITRRVAEALAEQEANRNLGPIVESESENEDDNKNGNGGGRRNGNGGRGNGGNGNGNGGRNGNNNNGNGDQEGNTGGAGSAARECTYKEFLNCQPFNFKGTEGASGWRDGSRRWNQCSTSV
ncbi:hypothetical protein Tco_1008100 [Tanacetum coccineum]